MKGFITPAVALIIGTLLLGVPFVAWYTAEPQEQKQEQKVGAFSDPFISLQVGSSPNAGDVLQTNGTESTWVATSSLGISGGSGGDSISVDGSAVTDPNFASTGNIDFVDTSNTITANINAGAVSTTSLSGTGYTSDYVYTASSTVVGGAIWKAVAGGGTVTSVDMSVPTGLSISGNPITGAGTLALSLTSGYVIPLTASTTEWFNFHTTPSGRITAGNNLTWSGNQLDVDDSFLLNTGDTGTGNYSFSGGTITNTGTTTLSTTTVGGPLTITGINHLYTHGIQALDSQGIHLHSNNETEIGFLGVGGGANVTWLGTNLFSGVTSDITTGTNEHFSIMPNGSGNVGIGTSTPTAKLQVTGTAGASDIFAISSSTNSRLLTVSAAGNVGIGDTSPVSLLTVGSGDLFQVNSSGDIITQSVGVDALESEDFGDFTCNGTACSVDSTLLAKDLAWTGTGTTTFAGNIDVAGTIEANVFRAVTQIVSSGDLDMGGNDILSVGTITATDASLTNATSSVLTVTGITSALGLFNSAGLLTEYTGIDCTNQFVRDVSAAGAGTCASVVSADITNDTIVNDDINTAAAIAYSKLSLSNSIVEGDLGIGAPTNDYILIASSSATGGMEWYSPTNIVAILESAIEAALDTLSNLVTVAISTTLQIPFGTTCDSVTDGETCHDTTDDQLIVKGKALPTEVPLYGFQIASTSAKFASSTSIKLPPQRLGYTVTTIICSVTSGTSKVILLFGESITCDASQEDDGTIASGVVGAASTTVPVVMGATSGSVDDVNISIFGTWTRQ